MGQVKVFSRQRLFDDFFKVDEAQVSFERFDGSMTPPVRRLVFERGDSVAAVVLRPRHASGCCSPSSFAFRRWRRARAG